MSEQRARRGLAVWREPLVCSRLPKVFNLRMNPYKRADIVSDQYDDWLAKNGYLIFDVGIRAAAFLETFVRYPPNQEAASFSIDQVQREVENKIWELAKPPAHSRPRRGATRELTAIRFDPNSRAAG
jgi:hypothetical protein